MFQVFRMFRMFLMFLLYQLYQLFRLFLYGEFEQMKTISQTLDLIYLHPHAQIAIRAAKNKKKWGREATRSYVKNNGCPMKLYILAQTLETIKQ